MKATSSKVREFLVMANGKVRLADTRKVMHWARQTYLRRVNMRLQLSERWRLTDIELYWICRSL